MGKQLFFEGLLLLVLCEGSQAQASKCLRAHGDAKAAVREALRKRLAKLVWGTFEKEILFGSKVFGICLFSFKQLEEDTTEKHCVGGSSDLITVVES